MLVVVLTLKAVGLLAISVFRLQFFSIELVLFMKAISCLAGLSQNKRHDRDLLNSALKTPEYDVES